MWWLGRPRNCCNLAELFLGKPLLCVGKHYPGEKCQLKVMPWEATGCSAHIAERLVSLLSLLEVTSCHMIWFPRSAHQKTSKRKPDCCQIPHRNWFYSIDNKMTVQVFVYDTNPNEGNGSWQSVTGDVMGAVTPVSSAKGLKLVWADIGMCNEGATCIWMAVKETVGLSN